MLAFQFFEVALAAMVAAIATLILCWPRRASSSSLALALPEESAPTFLLSGDALIDASPAAERILSHLPPGKTERETIVAGLRRHFPTLPETLRTLSPIGSAALTADTDPTLELLIDRQEENLRLGLVQGIDQALAPSAATVERDAMSREIALLRELTQKSPQMIWREDRSGALVWANDAYLKAADSGRGTGKPGDDVWPGAPIFPDLPEEPPAPDRSTSHRQSFQPKGASAAHWYEVTRIGVAGGVLNYATDASAAVKAESTQKAFMQTLGKTFANLSTGLAVFDRDRKLTLFNPAIIEMTGLPPAFLSARPTIGMVLDKLRESRKLPEPRDYTSFREQFTELERAVEKGTYIEHWTLPDGQTLKVTGRPHPDGGLAFNFEDISAEISLTRRFRTEIETGQAVLDGLPEAVAVFSDAQSLIMSNRAYIDLWDIEDGPVGPRQDLRDALRLWKAKSVPTAAWKSIETFALTDGDRPAIALDVVLTDGRQARCDVQGLANGVTMVRFAPRRSDELPAPTLLREKGARRIADR